MYLLHIIIFKKQCHETPPMEKYANKNTLSDAGTLLTLPDKEKKLTSLKGLPCHSQGSLGLRTNKQLHRAPAVYKATLWARRISVQTRSLHNHISMNVFPKNNCTKIHRMNPVYSERLWSSLYFSLDLASVFLNMVYLNTQEDNYSGLFTASILEQTLAFLSLLQSTSWNCLYLKRTSFWHPPNTPWQFWWSTADIEHIAQLGYLVCFNLHC